MLVSLLTGLVLTAAALLVVTLATARPSTIPVPPGDAFAGRWAALHGGIDPTASIWLRGWLRLTYVFVRPLAVRGVQPNVLTLWTLWLAALALPPAAAGGRWPLVAAVVVVASALADSLDGGVAALTDRATRAGYVLDSVVDRLAELVWLAAIVLCGAPVWAAGVCAVLFLLHDYLRARAGNAGAGEVVVLTVAERPTRTIVLVLTLAGTGLLPVHGAELALAGLGAMALLSTVGLAQLTAGVVQVLAATDDDSAS